MSVCLVSEFTDVEIFAKEEAVIALSACRHCAHAPLSYTASPPQPYLQEGI